MPISNTKLSVDDIRDEFGITTKISFQELYRGGGVVPVKDSKNLSRNLAHAVPQEDDISLGDFKGVARGFQYVCKDEETPAPCSGIFAADWTRDIPKTIQVPSGVEIGSKDTAKPALHVNADGSGDITLDIAGIVSGAGAIGFGMDGGTAIQADVSCSCVIKSGAEVRSGGGAGGRPGYGGAGGHGGILTKDERQYTEWVNATSDISFHRVGESGDFNFHYYGEAITQHDQVSVETGIEIATSDGVVKQIRKLDPGIEQENNPGNFMWAAQERTVTGQARTWISGTNGARNMVNAANITSRGFKQDIGLGDYSYLSSLLSLNTAEPHNLGGAVSQSELKFYGKSGNSGMQGVPGDSGDWGKDGKAGTEGTRGDSAIKAALSSNPDYTFTNGVRGLDGEPSGPGGPGGSAGKSIGISSGAVVTILNEGTITGPKDDEHDTGFNI